MHPLARTPSSNGDSQGSPAGLLRLFPWVAFAVNVGLAVWLLGRGELRLAPMLLLLAGAGIPLPKPRSRGRAVAQIILAAVPLGTTIVIALLRAH